MPETTSLEVKEYFDQKHDIIKIGLKNLICIDHTEEQMRWYDYLSFMHDYYSWSCPHASLIYQVLLLLLEMLVNQLNI